eukprot:NODE_4989_length_715_cov_5.224490_g4826_i0.p1 GENE.NODE_4989_length_715_cov_5.224490_g4826_i0~~NODE_4989_length_715_cov_5.224490_g4826_i0.p1  ORF type:complete len:204 (-),score=22.69 NODE_4989_length_715_cov_5.224490_g4826_i0:57-668(-)
MNGPTYFMPLVILVCAVCCVSFLRSRHPPPSLSFLPNFRRVGKGHVYRSASLALCNASVLPHLREHSISLLIDLRTQQELDQSPVTLPVRILPSNVSSLKPTPPSTPIHYLHLPLLTSQDLTHRIVPSMPLWKQLQLGVLMWVSRRKAVAVLMEHWFLDYHNLSPAATHTHRRAVLLLTWEGPHRASDRSAITQSARLGGYGA